MELISKDGDINQDWRDWENAFLATVSNFVPMRRNFKLETTSHG
jgi:hypothetical protein